MFFAVAWLRTFLLLTAFSAAFQAAARDEILFTSSVSYCKPPETLLVQQFDITYVKRNQSIVFNISAASVESNVNVTANLFLNVYGAHPFNTTIDLCRILNGALCPLPKYNFTGSDSIQLPSSLGVSNRIPDIAFKIPDLEAYAQLTLIEVGTGKVKACVQATLANGWSTRQRAVEWSTGGLALSGLLLSLWQSLLPGALFPFRLFDLVYLYQSIAASGLLRLNYPSVYRSFTLNFAWALGLISSPNSAMQRSIDNMRHHTGGNLADSSSGSAIGLVERKLSPYNDGAAFSQSTITVMKSILDSEPANPLPRPFESPVSNSMEAFDTAGTVVTYTSSGPGVLSAGVPIYVNSLHIGTANAFMTVFLITLIVFAVAIGLFGLGYLVLLAFRRKSWAEEVRASYSHYVRSWALRINLVLLMPGLIFTFYQWTLKDSWLATLFSVIFLLIVPGYVVYATFLTFRLATRSGPESIYAHDDFISSYGPLYAQYRTPRYYFFGILFAASLLKALLIGFGNAHGLTQAIMISIVELFVLGTTVALRSSKSKGGDVLSTFLAIARLLAAGLSIAFAEQLALKAIPRVVIGIMIVVVYSVAVVVMCFDLVVCAVWGVLGALGRRPMLRTRGSADEGILEKGEGAGVEGRSKESLPRFGRPINPTPDKNILLDPAVNRPYPDVTPAPTNPPTPTSASTLQSTTIQSTLPSASGCYSYGSSSGGYGRGYEGTMRSVSMIRSEGPLSPVSLSDLPPTPSSFGSEDDEDGEGGESDGTGSVTVTSEFAGASSSHGRH